MPEGRVDLGRLADLEQARRALNDLAAEARRRGPRCGCPECQARYERELARLSPHTRAEMLAAEQRAEALLAEHLTAEQLADWRTNRAFNVRGSLGGLFRVTPAANRSHQAVLRSDGVGIAVWPVGLAIEADWGLAMLCWLRGDELHAVNSGCHDHYSASAPMLRRLHDYAGRL